MRLISNDEMEVIASYMNEEIREEIHFKFAPCSNELFLREYLKRDSESLKGIMAELGMNKYKLTGETTEFMGKNAKVSGNANVSDNAKVSDNA